MGSEESQRTALADQAIDWLVRLDGGHADPAAFELWRNADPRHAAAFAQAAALWQQTGALRGADRELPPEITPAPPPETTPEAEFEATPVRASRRRVLASMAASLAVATVGAGYFLTSRRAYAETGVGERRVVQLPGGGRVELNTDTRIAWHLGDRLDLWLERGEAFIVVTNGGAHPCLAQAAPLIARLREGRYNLRLHPDGAQLITLAGEAQVTGGTGAALALRPGRSLQATRGGLRETALSEAELDTATAWQRGEIVFDGMTLATALGEFNRYLPSPIELGEATLGPVRLGGRFHTDDPQGFLQALHDSFGIDHRSDGNRIVLISANTAR